ncbi:MAG: molybdopterin-dependent oxidoreductase [Acidobacteriota bacterium]
MDENPKSSVPQAAPDTLPPGQVLTRKFPVVGEKAPPPEALDLDRWMLEVDGLVAAPRSYSYAALRALPQSRRRVDIHCVTGWSRLGSEIEGLPLAELLAPARPSAQARFVRFVAYSERAHDTSLPLDLALADTWLVHSVDGAPLSPEHGWPLRTVTPSRYFYKSLKWLRRIELLAEDRLGFWERDSAYHNVGDPWPGDQRFTTGSLEPAKLERFKSAESFDRWRRGRTVLLGLDLRGWSPHDRDLRGLQLKNCRLDGADLAGVDLRGANLSLSSLRGADLRGADCRGADLEGADFSGADLRDVDLRDTALSATRFVDEGAEGEAVGARVEGLRFDGAHGLLESQEDYLRSRSACDPPR